MPLPLPEASDFELTPAGSHVAICYRIVDLGTQLVEFNGESKKQHKIMIGWELTNELMQTGDNAGKPFSIHKRYTYSSSDKSTLRKDLESWRGKPFSKEDFGKFDIFKLIGIPCMLGVVHAERNGKTYSNITSIMRLPKGMEAPKLVNTPVQFNIAEFGQDVFDTFSDNLKALIMKSPEYARVKGLDRAEPNTHDEEPPMAEEYGAHGEPPF
jgi:hypothetical protein